MGSKLPRILIVDHFDSYTLNLLALLLSKEDLAGKDLAQAIEERIVVLPHTHPLLTSQAFHEHVRPHIDAIILSPGPGSPDKSTDFGAAEALLKDVDLNLPVLGVCLGHQGLATAFGGQVTRALSVRHGLQSKLKIEPYADRPEAVDGTKRISLLDGIPQDTLVVRYNSLVVDTETLPDCLRVTAWSRDEVSPAPAPRPGHFREARTPTTHRTLDATSPSHCLSASTDVTNVTASARSSVSLSTAHKTASASSDKESDLESAPSSADDIDEPDSLAAQLGQLQPAIMALQHKTLPFYGVQFHPESIESQAGHRLMSNFLALVRQFWMEEASASDLTRAQDAQRRLQSWPSPVLRLPKHLVLAGERCLAGSQMHEERKPLASAAARPLTIATHQFSEFTPDINLLMPSIFHGLFRTASPVGAMWLDSARDKDPHSRYSYMSVPAFSLSYKVGSAHVLLSTDGETTVELPLTTTDGQDVSFWTFVNELQRELMESTDMHELQKTDITDGNIFRIGFTGYWGYEMKNESLSLDTSAPVGDGCNLFDAEFFFCDRVLAYDHHTQMWTASALVAGNSCNLGTERLKQVMSKLQELAGVSSDAEAVSIGTTAAVATAWMQHVQSGVETVCRSDDPQSDFTSIATGLCEALPVLRPKMLAQDYMEQIESARELIAAGESYELCMTNQFQGQLPTIREDDAVDTPLDLDHFGLYCKLRARNPAPYSAFMRLPDLGGQRDAAVGKPQRGRAIVSTSPERFMRITRDGQVEMKPIKGTLARAGYGPGEKAMQPGCDTVEEETIKRRWRESEDERRRAKLAADVKERAENLMIVDLIRADLFSFCRADSVAVPGLMKVESYETVHQLVTTVSGQLKPDIGTAEAVRRCFPPGSMTGAPKRRSVQLLERLELSLADAEHDDNLRARRGIYSGALGWMGLDGAADFSVVIRTLVADGDNVSIGAGGAITYLSNPEREWQEVLDKVNALAIVDHSRQQDRLAQQASSDVPMAA
ncbi:ADC synthase [Testicularia cyperi]|uniref:aminodeoxychorismate synthase n=1 Tax=Testicularia cyperi TaxID=1882483 RepID=A0A317XQW9_9BASI|nr:ADC synthase [Testicularia cyperi]